MPADSVAAAMEKAAARARRLAEDDANPGAGSTEEKEIRPDVRAMRRRPRQGGRKACR